MVKSTHSTAVLPVPAGRNALSVADHQQAIAKCFQKNAGNALELAMLCREAHEQIMDDELGSLKKGLAITWSNFSKLAVIGRDARMYEAGMEERLPGAFSVIYAIACIKPGAEWDAALAADVIHPGASRRGINEWKRAFRNEPEPTKKTKTVADTVASAIKKDKVAFLAALGEIGIVPVQDVAPVASTGGSIVNTTENDVAAAEA
jgi:hypothetical protein